MLRRNDERIKKQKVLIGQLNKQLSEARQAVTEQTTRSVEALEARVALENQAAEFDRKLATLADQKHALERELRDQTTLQETESFSKVVGSRFSGWAYPETAGLAYPGAGGSTEGKRKGLCGLQSSCSCALAGAA